VDAGTNKSPGGLDRLGKRLKALSGTLYWYVTQGRPTRKRWQAAKQAGEAITLDDLGPPVRARTDTETPADFTPNPGRLRKAKFMKLDAYPDTDYSFTLETPPVSGNQLNGQGETAHRPATPIFHTWQYKHPMGKLEFLFQASRTPAELIALLATQVAAHIRSIGWQAEAAIHNMLHIPAAVNAGLGQLGKHGSLIAEQAGSMYRLGAVVTDLPLTYDAPRDIAVDDFCATCQICTTNCPPQAILPEKQTLRGVERWYVDFDKCIPYFVENHGCGICIGVCPWSEEGRGEHAGIDRLDAHVAPPPAPAPRVRFRGSRDGAICCRKAARIRL